MPVVGVDGWSRIINQHPEFDGLEFTDGEVGKDGLPSWIECTIHRKDRQHPIRAREYMAECKRNTVPWGSHPRRMLRHKAMIQCARLAFSYTGIYDQDEAERIVEMGAVDVVDPTPAVAEMNSRIRARGKPADAPVDVPEPAPADEPAPPAISYAKVADAINRAKSIDTLDVAADLIGSVSDEQQQSELLTMVSERREALSPR